MELRTELGALEIIKSIVDDAFDGPSINSGMAAISMREIKRVIELAEQQPTDTDPSK